MLHLSGFYSSAGESARVNESFIDRLWRTDRVYPLAILGFLIVGCLAAVGYWYISSPTKYVAAAAPRDGAEAKLLGAFGEALREERRDVRVSVQAFDELRESAQALQDKRVHLAVVRPDVLLPTNGLTIGILREEALIVAVPEAGDVDDFTDLAKKRLGVVAHHTADLPAIESVLAHYDLQLPNLTIVMLEADDVEAAVKAKRVDAVAFLAVAVSERAGRLVRAVARASNDKVRIVPIAEAEAFALKNPALTPATIPPGALIGRPQVPKEEVKTIAVSYRLMARSGLDRGPISKVTEYLFQMRSRIARATAAIHLMKAPENENATSAALPNHPGAVDYFNREQMTFMDRYGDWLWLAVFAAGGVSSALAWMAQLFKRRRRELVDEVLERLADILHEARDAESAAKLDDLTREIDRLVATSLRYARQRTTPTRVVTALMLAIDSGRSAIADRRRDILAGEAVGQAVPRAEPRRIIAAS
jgi:TRAP-type uncharacterized transport system substrate-binding protein